MPDESRGQLSRFGSSIVVVDDLILNTGLSVVERNGEVIDCTPAEFDALHALASRAGGRGHYVAVIWLCCPDSKPSRETDLVSRWSAGTRPMIGGNTAEIRKLGGVLGPESIPGSHSVQIVCR